MSDLTDETPEALRVEAVAGDEIVLAFLFKEHSPEEVKAFAAALSRAIVQSGPRFRQVRVYDAITGAPVVTYVTPNMED